jgi:DMSO/TMAO reductase YedYZ molybdopterin-dependent catalytic subunit
MDVKWLKILFAMAGMAFTGPAWSATPDAILVNGAPVAAADIARLPAIEETVSFGTEHGPLKAIFGGPLLWTVLNAAHAIDPAKPKAAVRSYVVITGSDGYVAVIALGEIEPAFENKRVLLAETMDGKALGPGHLRVVVPGDARGGRSVRDVVSITVLAAPAK